MADIPPHLVKKRGSICLDRDTYIKTQIFLEKPLQGIAKERRQAMNNLQNERRWVVWNQPAEKKQPLNAKNGAAVVGILENKDYWGDYETALETAQRLKYGVGVMLGDGIAGIDIDDCINDRGELSDLANRILKLFAGKTYVETTPSGHGLHILLKYSGGNVGTTGKAGVLEVYTGGRYFTYTGQGLPDCSETLTDCTSQFLQVAEIARELKEAAKPSQNANGVKFAHTIHKASQPPAVETHLQAREYFLRHAADVLTPARTRGEICPICGNGTGKSGTGLETKADGIHKTCFKCSPEKGDPIHNASIFDIIGAAFALDTYTDQFNKLCELFGVDSGTLIDDRQATAEEDFQELDAPADKAGAAKTFTIMTDRDRLPAFRQFVQAAKQPIKTGFPNLDEAHAGGLYSGLYLTGAINSLGKTAFLLQIAANIARQNLPVLFVSLEMSANELIARHISRETYTAGATLAKTARGILRGETAGSYSDEERAAVENAYSVFSSYAGKLYTVEGEGDVTPKKIRAFAEAVKDKEGTPPVVFVDYVQIVRPEKNNLTDKQVIDVNIVELKRISRDLDTPVIGISSLNRDNYSNSICVEALKESGSLEYTADVIWGLQFKGAGARTDKKGKPIFDVNAAKAKEPREVELIILKNRNGATGSKLEFNYYAKFNAFEAAAGFSSAQGEKVRREILNVIEAQNGSPLLLVELCGQVKGVDRETVINILEENGYRIAAGGYVEAVKQNKAAQQKAAILSAFDKLKSGGDTVELVKLADYLGQRKSKTQKDIKDLCGNALTIRGDIVTEL